MPEVRCPQCAEEFTTQSWTTTCPRCDARFYSPPPGDAASPPPDAPPFEPVAPPPVLGDVIPAARRRRRWPLAVLGGLLLAGAVGGGFIVADRLHSDYPKKWDPRVKDLADFVERQRALPFKHPVRIDFLSDAEFRRQATAHGKLTPDEKASLQSQTAMLRAVGLVTGDVDLTKIGDELVGDGTVGLYRFEDHRISVRGEKLDDERRSTLVHELTHALQDQNFDIGKRQPKGSGAQLAFTAVAEADADEVESAWDASLSDAAQKALQAAQERTGGSADFKGVPAVFVELMSFPYQFGPDLLHAVISAQGAVGRDGLFTRPPVSEEQIILPATYLAKQPVEKVKTPTLAPGEKLVKDSADDFGMVSLLVVLAERIDYSVAWQAVQGWAGDSVVAFERGGATCVRLHVAFDDAAQADRFEAAFVQWSQGFTTKHSRDDKLVEVESCDPGTKGPAPRAAGHVSGLQGLALRRELMDTLAAAGLPTTRTACVADRAIEIVGADRFEVLNQQSIDNPKSRATAELRSAGAKAAQACP
jgi:hypothetical protein